ncbi:copper-binding protein [Ramlibacter sp. H39-3-26]|uniref:copper-binding protein n=1 Tax=Curvibacter soli TaxID=3031331 RepID=UPI0023DB6D79|nr:copper-binding protein [Ramlibacter sp. H39-3-26]MDF1484138.1 copper-binding protein [Ramlibacter sp. H39-3-26]
MKDAPHPRAFILAHNPALQLGALILLGLLPALNSAWAQSSARPQPPVSSALPSTLALTHAVIERVLHDTGEIVLDHEDLPNLGMPPMTMAFDVSNETMLKAFKAGDNVRFQAEIVAGKPTITRLERAP